MRRRTFLIDLTLDHPAEAANWASYGTRWKDSRKRERSGTLWCFCTTRSRMSSERATETSTGSSCRSAPITRSPMASSICSTGVRWRWPANTKWHSLTLTRDTTVPFEACEGPCQRNGAWIRMRRRTSATGSAITVLQRTFSTSRRSSPCWRRCSLDRRRQQVPKAETPMTTPYSDLDLETMLADLESDSSSARSRSGSPAG